MCGPFFVICTDFHLRYLTEASSSRREAAWPDFTAASVAGLSRGAGPMGCSRTKEICSRELARAHPKSIGQAAFIPPCVIQPGLLEQNTVGWMVSKQQKFLLHGSGGWIQSQGPAWPGSCLLLEDSSSCCKQSFTLAYVIECSALGGEEDLWVPS